MSLSFARGWKFDQFQTQIPTTRDNMQQGVQTGQYPTMLRPFARGFILLTTRNAKQEIKNKKISHSISTKVSQLFKGCYILRQKLVTFRVKKLLLFAALR